MSKEDWRHEWEQHATNMRLYENMRFMQFTVFFAVTGALMAALFAGLPGFGGPIAQVLKSLGIVMTLAFLLMHERSICYYKACHRQAIRLEGDDRLSYNVYRALPDGWLAGILTSRNATRVVYAALCVFWTLTLLFPRQLG
jgi:hypothetical protein